MIVFVFVVLLACEAPVYTVVRMRMKFFPARNKTLLGTVSSPDRHHVETISYTINNFFLPLTAFVVVISCTGILVRSLQNQTQWRTKTTIQADHRNRNVAKMVVMISALFISCFVPMSVLVLFVAANSDFNEGGKSEYISIYTGGICFVLESINSSSNIFIYYHMSIKYRKTFNMIFFKCAI